MLRFADVEFLYLLSLVPLLAVFYFLVFRWKRQAMQRFGKLDLVEKLAGSTSRGRQVARAVLVVLALLFMILALARPQLGTRLEEVKREGVDVFVALDVSSSMLARDIEPSRLAKAKHELSAFIDMLRGDRIGLIAFAGDAFVQCPLTLDYGAAKTFLRVMEPDLVPTPGTNLGDAIKLALEHFETKERKHKVLVLVTDGEDHSGKAVEMARAAEKEGVVIYTIGIGSPKGVPIPVYDNQGNRVGFKKDRQGDVVLTKLDEVTLQKIALTTGGKYHLAATGDVKLRKVYDEIAGMEKKELASLKFSQFEERFQYVLFLALMLLLAELLLPERKRTKTEWRGRFV